MNVQKCLIVEDTKIDSDLLKSYITPLPFLSVLGVCTNYSEAIAFITNNQVDLIFLDIELDSLSGERSLTGLDLLKTLPNLPPVIIMTNRSDYASESYRIGKAVDFLVKPYDFERFLIAVNRVFQLKVGKQQFTNEGFIFLKMGRKFQRFELDELDYLEAYGIYLKVIEKGIIYVVNDTISAITERLDPSQFVRVHKSYIINVKKITGFDHKNLFLQEKKIPIGISYKGQLGGLLSLFDKLEC